MPSVPSLTDTAHDFLIASRVWAEQGKKPDFAIVDVAGEHSHHCRRTPKCTTLSRTTVTRLWATYKVRFKYSKTPGTRYTFPAFAQYPSEDVLKEPCMRGRLVCLPLLVVTLMSALAVSPFQLQKTALVTVIAEAGGPVASLTADDFVVREDRAMRQVVAAERAAEPIFVTLLVDTVAPPIPVQDGRAGLPQTQDLRRGLTSFVTTIKGGSPDAQIAVMEYAGAAVTVLDFTSEKTAWTGTFNASFRTGGPTAW